MHDKPRIKVIIADGGETGVRKVKDDGLVLGITRRIGMMGQTGGDPEGFAK